MGFCCQDKAHSTPNDQDLALISQINMNLWWCRLLLIWLPPGVSPLLSKTDNTGQQETGSVTFDWKAVHVGHIVKVVCKIANTSFDTVLAVC